MSVGPVNPSQNVQNGQGGTNVPPFVQFMLEYSNFYTNAWCSAWPTSYTFQQAMSHFVSLLQEVPNNSPDYQAAQQMISDLQTITVIPPNFAGGDAAFSTGLNQLLSNYQDASIITKNPSYQLSLAYGLLGFVYNQTAENAGSTPPPNTIPLLREAINTFLLPNLQNSQPALYATVAPLLTQALDQYQTGDFPDGCYTLSQVINSLSNSGLFPYPPIS